jgi:iron complex outermembrane receptor protein
MRKFLTACLSCTALMSSGAAMAQSDATQSAAQEAPDGALGEIIVTAQKRESKIEKTSVALTVLDGALIADQGIREIKGINAIVPGMTMNESPGGLTEIGIRGVSTSAANQLFEQSVGLFIDGIYHPRQRQYRDGLFDVQRIEVIKGSQGVLFGKNTSVGALSIISRRPGRDFGGYVAADYETRYGSRGLEGALDIPTGEDAALRVAGLYTDTHGYVFNASKSRDEERAKRWLVRGTFDWRASDSVGVVLKMQASDLDITGSNFEVLASGNPAYLQSLGVADGGARDFVKHADSSPSGDEGDHQVTYDPSLTVTIDTAGGGTITSTTGYSNFRYRNGFDLDGTPQPAYYNFFRETFKQVTQELRYASPTGGAIEYIAGLFFLDQRDRFNFDSLYRNFMFPHFTGYEEQLTRQHERDVALFGQVNWAISDQWKVAAGARLSNTRKTGTYIKTIPSTLGDPASILPFIIQTGKVSGKINRTNVDATATLSYAPDPRSTLYVSVGRGTKASSFNNTSPLLGVVPAPFIVPDEIATTYEFGAKSRFWGGRALLSLAAYHLDIKGYQDSYFDGNLVGFLVRSLPAKSSGLELEGQVQANGWLNIYGNIGWNPTAKLRLPNGVEERLQRAARFTGVLGARVSTDITEALSLSGTVQYQHSSGFYHQPPGSGGDIFSGAYGLMDGRVALKLRSGPEFSLRVENITGEKYRAFSFLTPTDPTTTMGYWNRPRTVTLGARFDF